MILKPCFAHAFTLVRTSDSNGFCLLPSMRELVSRKSEGLVFNIYCSRFRCKSRFYWIFPDFRCHLGFHLASYFIKNREIALKQQTPQQVSHEVSTSPVLPVMPPRVRTSQWLMFWCQENAVWIFSHYNFSKELLEGKFKGSTSKSNYSWCDTPWAKA